MRVYFTFIAFVSMLFFSTQVLADEPTSFNPSMDDFDLTNVTKEKNPFFDQQASNPSLNEQNVSDLSSMESMFIDTESFKADEDWLTPSWEDCEGCLSTQPHSATP